MCWESGPLRSQNTKYFFASDLDIDSGVIGQMLALTCTHCVFGITTCSLLLLDVLSVDSA